MGTSSKFKILAALMHVVQTPSDWSASLNEFPQFETHLCVRRENNWRFDFTCGEQLSSSSLFVTSDQTPGHSQGLFRVTRRELLVRSASVQLDVDVRLFRQACSSSSSFACFGTLSARRRRPSVPASFRLGVVVLLFKTNFALFRVLFWWASAALRRPRVFFSFKKTRAVEKAVPWPRKVLFLRSERLIR